MKVVLGSRNSHKLAEMRALLPDWDLDCLPEGLEEVAETGDSFGENACLKSTTYAKQLDSLVLADDSGLCVVALRGEPGVRSARWAADFGREHPAGVDAANNAYLLERLRGEMDRRAAFVCVLSLASPEGQLLSVEGRCEGRILAALAGEGGFGYDPLFFSDDLAAPFGRAPAKDKNRVSHRFRACRQLLRLGSERGLCV